MMQRSFGILRDYYTGEIMRAATEEEWLQSRSSPAGFRLGRRRVYVAGGPTTADPYAVEFQKKLGGEKVRLHKFNGREN